LVLQDDVSVSFLIDVDDVVKSLKSLCEIQIHFSRDNWGVLALGDVVSEYFSYDLYVMGHLIAHLMVSLLPDKVGHVPLRVWKQDNRKYHVLEE